MLAALGACVSVAPEAEQPAAVTAPAAASDVVRFSYPALDGGALSDERLRGRVSVIAFVATYDVASQAEARFLAGIARSHTPRVNVALLVLESPDNLPLAQAFADTLGFPGPVGMADAATIAGRGPFAGLHHVPSVVILDRRGVEVWRHVGLVQPAEIERAITDAESRGSGAVD